MSRPRMERPPRVKPGQLDSRPVHHGRVVDLALDTVRFPDGSTGDLEMIRHSGAAAVVPLLEDRPDQPVVLMVRQFRYATGGELLEIPAGRPDTPDEPWEDCARRELEEEVGYRAGALHYLASIWTTPGFTDELIHIFLARDLGAGTVNHDADEFIEPVRIPLDDALRMIRAGEIMDAKSIAGLFLAASALDTP